MRLTMAVVTTCWCRSGCGTAGEVERKRRQVRMRVAVNHIEETTNSTHPGSVWVQP